jgi:RNA polymerase sigma-70 factor (ECF subfamily)
VPDVNGRTLDACQETWGTWHGTAGDLDAVQAVATDPLAELPERLAAADLASLLGTLTDDQRDVLLLRIVADLSVAETAAVLGKPTGAIKSLQHRALAALARALTSVPVSPTASTTTTSLRWNGTD